MPAATTRSDIRTYKGVGVSPGIAIGRAVIVEKRVSSVYRIPIREEEVAAAIRDGLTLDQLNLRAGDELVVGEETNRHWFQTMRTFMLIPGLILSLAGVLRLAGII